MTLNDDLEGMRKETEIAYSRVYEYAWLDWDSSQAHADFLPVSPKSLLHYSYQSYAVLGVIFFNYIN
jgi:hypothetical protein